MADWKKIKAEYIKGGTSYQRLADKYGVPFGTLQRIAREQQWRKLRKKSEEKASEKIVASIAEANASKALKIYDVADKLLEKIMFNLENSDVLGSQEVKHYTSALKDIKDIKGVKSDIDLKEQNARIDKLRKEAEEEQKDTKVTVTFNNDLDKYSN